MTKEIEWVPLPSPLRCLDDFFLSLFSKILNYSGNTIPGTASGAKVSVSGWAMAVPPPTTYMGRAAPARRTWQLGLID
jgi:hypothetical protein